MSDLYLDFYGFVVKISCSVSGVLELLSKDFSFFVSEGKAPNLEISAKVTKEIDEIIPRGLLAKRQNTRAITFEFGPKRFNYFYGKAVSVLDYESNSMEVYSKDECYLHEILYLAVLSRETKFHDLKGLHKVHAFGIGKGDTALIGMMNMKGGKTTLFSYFIDQQDYELISDDTPLVSWKGEILPFPIRIGFELESHTRERLENYEDRCYHFEREEYGPKKLIDLGEFSNPEAAKKKRIVLFQGVRCHGLGQAEAVKVTRYSMFRYLLKNMVIGVGLPMVLEYYLESGWKAKIRNFEILLRRTFAALSLLTNSHCYEVRMGNDPEKNYAVVKGLLDRYAR